MDYTVWALSAPADADLVSLKFPYAEADDRDALAGRVGAVLRALHGRFGWRVYDPLVSRGATRRHRSLLRRFSRRP